MDEQNWFDMAVTKTVRGGDATKFWLEDWLGGGCLRGKYYRLYNLSKLKWARVCDCGFWDLGTWRWKLLWRRPLVGRELNWEHNLIQELGAARLCEDSLDNWTWTAASDGNYSVNSAYLLLQEPTLPVADAVFSGVWRSFAPSGVKAFTWRLLLDRIATMDNLLQHHVLPSTAAANCRLCQNQLETSFHLLFTCSFAVGLWHRCSSWLDLSFSTSSSSRDHLLAFLAGFTIP